MWFLKVRSLTEQTYIDETEVEDEGIAELTMDDNKIADVASRCGLIISILHECPTSIFIYSEAHYALLYTSLSSLVIACL